MNTKKLISAILTASTLFCSFAFEAKCNTESASTNIYADYENDLDESGGWKYRELIPDVSCENIKYFAHKTKLTAATPVTGIEDAERGVELSADAYSGDYSIAGNMSGYGGLGTKVDFLEYNTKYRMSFMGKMEPVGDNNTLTELTTFTPSIYVTGVNSTTVKDVAFSGAETIGTEWKQFSKETTIKPSSITGIDAQKPMLVYFHPGAKKLSDTTTNAEFKLYIDDWSMRRMVPEEFMETEMLSAVYDSEENTLTYKFNLDIDHRTVRKENIKINDELNSEYVQSAALEMTNETTREHTLTITLQNLAEGNKYVIQLPSLKDAWGREVSGNQAFVIGTYPEGQYTIFNDLDATGKWKYRELVSDISCENIKYFANKTALISAQSVTGIADADRGVTLSDDAYSGDYSIVGKMSGFSGIGTRVDYLEYGAKYHMSLMVKMDPVNNEIEELDTFTPYRVVYGSNGTQKDTALGGAKKIGAEWTQISLTPTMNPSGITDINTEKPMIFYFNPSAKKLSDGTTNAEFNLYIDDWSIRRVLPDDFFTAEVTDAELIDNKAVFTFNLDIDPRTVRAENILINGKPTANKIESVNIETEEDTRITTLEIELCNLEADTDYTVDISSVKDAWGRSIEGEKTVEFSTPAAVDMSVEFKSDGKSLTKMVDGSIEAKVSLTNNMADPDMIVVAAVCKDNRFVKVVPQEVTLSKGASDTVTLNIDAGTGNDAIRLFLWEDSEKGLPLTNYGELSKNGFNKAMY